MKGVLLLSGGIDSPVAGYLMKEKEVELVALTFTNELFAEDDSEIKSKKIIEKLGIEKLYLVNHGELQATVARECNHRYFYVLTRRIMWQIAEEIAKKENADFLVTGESLGQVGSQTLHNLTNVMEAVKIKILRPLLSWDKMEIVKLAREINTYETSKGPEICSVFGPKNPATKTKIEVVKEEERKINKNKLIEEALKSLKLIETEKSTSKVQTRSVPQ